MVLNENIFLNFFTVILFDIIGTVIKEGWIDKVSLTAVSSKPFNYLLQNRYFFHTLYRQWMITWLRTGEIQFWCVM